MNSADHEAVYNSPTTHDIFFELKPKDMDVETHVYDETIVIAEDMQDFGPSRCRRCTQHVLPTLRSAVVASQERLSIFF